MTYKEIIPRGKYKGMQVAELLDKDPQYIIDIMDRRRLSFCDEVLEEAQNRVDYHNFIEEDRNYELRRVFREVE